MNKFVVSYLIVVSLPYGVNRKEKGGWGGISRSTSTQDFRAPRSHIVHLAGQFVTLFLDDFMSSSQFGFEYSGCLPSSVAQVFHLGEHVAELVDELISAGLPFVHRKVGEVVAAVMLGKVRKKGELVVCGGV